MSNSIVAITIDRSNSMLMDRGLGRIERGINELIHFQKEYGSGQCRTRSIFIE
jgi:hypothetical protein